MQTYIYSDRRVKYYYIIPLSILYMLPLMQLQSFAAHFFSSILIAAMGCILLFIVLSRFRQQVYFKKDKVYFVRLSTKCIRLESIQSIRLYNSGDLSYQVTYNRNSNVIWSLSFYESDKDISVFRSALAEIIQRTRDANPNVKVDDHCMLMCDGTSEYAGKQSMMAYDKRAALTGLNGWLVYIIIGLFAISILTVQNAVNYLSAYQTSTAGIGALMLVSAALKVGTLLFTISALVALFKKKISSKTHYVNFWIYDAVVSFIIGTMNYVFGCNGFHVVDILFNMVLPAIYSIVMIFAWKTYFERSIRVRNTLVN